MTDRGNWQAEVEEINRKIANLNKSLGVAKNRQANQTLLLVIVSSIVISGLLFLALKPQFLGLVTFAETYEKNISLTTSSNKSLVIQLDGPPTSLRLSGSLVGTGNSSVYLLQNNNRMLIAFVRYTLPKNAITGTIIGQENLTGNSTPQPITYFDNVCAETCSLSAVAPNITLLIEIHNATLLLTKLTYTLAKEENLSHLPYWDSNLSTFAIEGPSLINLSNYFADPNNETLTYLVTTADNLSLNLTHEVLKIIPARNILATRIITVYASDAASTIGHDISLLIDTLQNITSLNESEHNLTAAVINVTNESVNLTQTNISIFTNVSLENISAVINFTFNISTFRLVQGRAVVGKPVVWTKTIQPGANKTTFELPANSTIVSATKIIAGNRTVLSLGLYSSSSMAKFYTTDELAESFEIVYETAAPTVSELVLGANEKKVTVSAGYNYTNVSVFTNITKAPRDKVRLYWDVTPRDYEKYFGVPHTNQTQRVDITFNSLANITFVDHDNDGLIEEIGWIVPHLSNQTFDIVIFNESTGTLRHYFVTSAEYNGNLGGQQAADAKCNSDSNRIVGKLYTAWLSEIPLFESKQNRGKRFYNNYYGSFPGNYLLDSDDFWRSANNEQLTCGSWQVSEKQFTGGVCYLVRESTVGSMECSTSSCDAAHKLLCIEK